MYQREIIEMHMHLINRGWDIKASKSEGVWLYNFSKTLGLDTYKIELRLERNGFTVVTTKNSVECKELIISFASYNQSLYGMEELCNRIENQI